MNERFQSANRLLTERVTWESKQRLFYRMRHDGLPRSYRPFPGCADAHYPEIDMAIRRLKPFWVGQLLSGEKLCVFTALKNDLSTMNDAAGDFFDFELNQRSQFLREMRHMVDFMLLTGRGVIKCTVDPLDSYKLVFEAVDPYYIIIPEAADSFEDADEFVHCRPFTVKAYERLDERYDKSDGTIKRIRGTKDYQSLGLYEQEIRLREGINYTSSPEQILVWEHYVKTQGGWTVCTYSPMAPDVELRAPYQVPYKVRGKVSVPFFSFQMEVKDKGWYSPRGIAELIAPIEQYMTKLWNEKADAMTFANRPLYTGEKPIENMANYRWAPGEYLPGNVQAIQHAAPPFSFDQEIMFARSIAEQQSQSPDFGITRPDGAGTSDPRTATEVKSISALASAGVNDSGMLFREDLTKLYRHAWGLIVQFRQREFVYFASGEVQSLPEQALHDQYLITPDGSADGWNKMAVFQKSLFALNAFKGNPNVDTAPLTKRALASYDSRMALKAFIPTNLRGANEYEDEVIEINAMLAPPMGRPSFPAQVMPQEDHATRIKACVDWLQACAIQKVPPDPVAILRVRQHMAQHFQILKQQNPAAAKQVAQMVKQIEMQAQQQQQGAGQGGPAQVAA
jgi:hypothetical protein